MISWHFLSSSCQTQRKSIPGGWNLENKYQSQSKTQKNHFSMHNRQFACMGIRSKLSKLSINFIISLESFLVSASFAKSFSVFLLPFPSWIRARNEMESKFCGFCNVNLKSGKNQVNNLKFKRNSLYFHHVTVFGINEL